MKIKDLLANFCVLLLLVSAVVSAEGQKKKPVKKTSVVTRIENEPLAIPEIKDFAYVVNIDKNAKVRVTVQTSEDSEFVADSANQQPLNDFFTSVARSADSKTPNKTQESFRPIIIVNADKDLYFKDVIDVLQAVRVSPSQKIKLKIADNLYVFIPRKIDENEKAILKPNPNTLIAFLEKNYKIRLNQDEMGDISNTVALTEMLKEVFKYREINGIYREGTNEVQKTVLVNLPTSVKFGEVINFVQIIAGSGAFPIGLQTDDLGQ